MVKPIFVLALAIAIASAPSLARAAPRAADDLGEQLLAATRKGDLVSVKRLLDQGANINTRTRYDSTPLFFACDRGYVEIVRLLIERGADLNLHDNFYNATALGMAMSKKHHDVVALLIEKGADPAEALRDSIEEGDRATFQLILDKGKLSQSVLDDALLVATVLKSEKNEGMAKLLADKGAGTVSFSVDEATLKGYEGRFSDADTNMTFSVKEGKLNFVGQQSATPLVPTAIDRFRFVQAGLEFRFERNEKGEVVGLRFASRGGDTKLKRVN